MSEDLERAEEIYVLRSVLRDGEPSPGLVGIGDLVRLVRGGSSRKGSALDVEQTRFLFSQPRLMKIYRALKQPLAVAELGMAAAASDGDIPARFFDGGRLTLSFQADGSASIFVQLDEEVQWPAVDLILQSENDGVVRLAFQTAPWDDGTMLEFLDLADPAHQALIRMIRDPYSEGTFVRTED